MQRVPFLSRVAALPLIGLVRIYRYTLSAFMGRSCRYLPTCSEYTETALRRHGGWAGGWIGLARICRCRPGGDSGLDFVCEALPPEGRWYAPWRYGLWRGTNPVPPSRVTEQDP
jgi:putative membrane protein insertion efficiency factor